MSKTIVIYDFDALAYRASAVIDGRSILVKHNKSGREKEFKNITEFKELMKSKNLELDLSKYEVTEQQNPQPFNVCSSIIDNQIEGINSQLFADEYLLCISGSTNFRDDLPLPTKYKSNRTATLRPVHLNAIKKYALRKHPSQVAINREADDDVIIKCHEYIDKGYNTILVQYDKDAFSASGLALYDFTKENPQIETVPDFGYLEVIKGKPNNVVGRGFMWLMFQMINGDKSDMYQPCELAGVKYGQMSAYKALKDCTTKEQALLAVIKQYKTWYPKPFDYKDWTGEVRPADYLSMLQLYFKCARMMQYEGDDLDVIKFFNEHGVQL